MRIIAVCLMLAVAPSLGVVAWKEFQRKDLGPATQPLQLHTPGEVLFFNASWCGPCRQMKPIVAQLKRQGYRMRDVDVDQNRKLADKYHISGIPTFVFLQNGKEVSRFSGGTSIDHLKKLCSNPAYH